jgi:hypothetical protein
MRYKWAQFLTIGANECLRCGRFARSRLVPGTGLLGKALAYWAAVILSAHSGLRKSGEDLRTGDFVTPAVILADHSGLSSRFARCPVASLASCPALAYFSDGFVPNSVKTAVESLDSRVIGHATFFACLETDHFVRRTPQTRR